ncbi:hypothetical protein GBAR_LOCUS12297, partial [Geodia barretti]
NCIYIGEKYRDFHQEELQKHCRVCGNKLRDRNIYKCSNTAYRERLALLGVNCDHDVETVHPKYFCNQCYRSAQRQHTSPGSTQIQLFLWREHSESSCEVCQHFRSLQRPGRKPSKRGRPPTDGKRILGNHIRRLM